MPVRDEPAVRKPLPQTSMAPGRCAPVVHDADPEPLPRNHESLGQLRDQLGIVHVAVYRLQAWTEPPELGQGRGARDVAGVDDQARPTEDLDAGVRQPPLATRQVRVAEDRDQGTPGRKRPSR